MGNDSRGAELGWGGGGKRKGGCIRGRGSMVVCVRVYGRVSECVKSLIMAGDHSAL